MAEASEEQRVLTNTMHAASENAQLALFRGIKSVAEAVNDASYGEGSKAAVLQNLALAFRYAVGGTQPGSVVVNK